jgi:methylated-DNA-[protein]-cysteine S-methyltransferase
MTIESASSFAARRISSPVGGLLVCARNGALTRLTWCGKTGREPAPVDDTEKTVLDQAIAQLAAYFAGDLHRFDLPVAPAGTPFQLRVWAAMSAIPFGRTRTYGELAGEVGGVARAVGQACGANPIPIIIPCHRVVAGGGRLGGFSGGRGRETKRALLVHEHAVPEGRDLFAPPARTVTNAPAGR